MSVGRIGAINGFHPGMVEMAGRILRQHRGDYLFDDGVRIRRLPMSVVHWRPLKDGFVLMSMPSWLAQQPRFHAKRKPPEIAKWSTGQGQPKRWKGFT